MPDNRREFLKKLGLGSLGAFLFVKNGDAYEPVDPKPVKLEGIGTTEAWNPRNTCMTDLAMDWRAPSSGCTCPGGGLWK